MTTAIRPADRGAGTFDSSALQTRDAGPARTLLQPSECPDRTPESRYDMNDAFAPSRRPLPLSVSTRRTGLRFYGERDSGRLGSGRAGLLDGRASGRLGTRRPRLSAHLTFGALGLLHPRPPAPRLPGGLASGTWASDVPRLLAQRDFWGREAAGAQDAAPSPSHPHTGSQSRRRDPAATLRSCSRQNSHSHVSSHSSGHASAVGDGLPRDVSLTTSSGSRVRDRTLGATTALTTGASSTTGAGAT